MTSDTDFGSTGNGGVAKGPILGGAVVHVTLTATKNTADTLQLYEVATNPVSGLLESLVGMTKFQEWGPGTTAVSFDDTVTLSSGAAALYLRLDGGSTSDVSVSEFVVHQFGAVSHHHARDYDGTTTLADRTANGNDATLTDVNPVN